MNLMTLQPRPTNPIEKRKADVRKYSRNTALWVAGGLGGGLAMFLISGFGSAWLILGFIIAVVGGLTNYNKVRKIINHKD